MKVSMITILLVSAVSAHRKGDRVLATVPEWARCGGDPNVWYPATVKDVGGDYREMRWGGSLCMRSDGYVSNRAEPDETGKLERVFEPACLVQFDHLPACCDSPTEHPHPNWRQKCTNCYVDYETGLHVLPQGAVLKSELPELQEGEVVLFGKKWSRHDRFWDFQNARKASFLTVDPKDRRNYIVKIIDNGGVAILPKAAICRPRNAKGEPLHAPVVFDAIQFSDFSAKEGAKVEALYTNPETKKTEWVPATFLRVQKDDATMVIVKFRETPTVWDRRERNYFGDLVRPKSYSRDKNGVMTCTLGDFVRLTDNTTKEWCKLIRQENQWKARRHTIRIADVRQVTLRN